MFCHAWLLWLRCAVLSRLLKHEACETHFAVSVEVTTAQRSAEAGVDMAVTMVTMLCFLFSLPVCSVGQKESWLLLLLLLLEQYLAGRDRHVHVMPVWLGGLETLNFFKGASSKTGASDSTHLWVFFVKTLFTELPYR